MAKHKKKHIVKLHRGRPVKPKAVKLPKGRPPIHSAEDTAHTFIRSTPSERTLWESAARYESQMLKLPQGSELSLNGWIKRALNERSAVIAAHANGIVVDSKVVADIEASLAPAPEVGQ
jgi:hypothetical protein